MSQNRFAVTPLPRPTVPVRGSDILWPVRRVLCVGRNYAEHAREMGANPDREPPFFFTKPGDSVAPASGTIAYPPLTTDLHHEVELVVAIGTRASGVTPEEASACIYGYSVGVDLTRRDLQNEAKEMRRPWDWGKAFDQSAPLTPIVPFTQQLNQGRIWLAVNGDIRQEANIADMIWSVEEIVSFASQSITLLPGDLIFTGTPAGVGAVHPGDVLSGGVHGVASFAFSIGKVRPAPAQFAQDHELTPTFPAVRII
ncbi:fumarylacetoacetate hydrolase family protein [Paenarthrobacter sp. NPDC089989]|uniref:fumarylacetoacetate hydrolase family protein n=1 Tax=unclassified Paenarthrobacter TaxID=2634190 RepID=UPI0038135ACB